MDPPQEAAVCKAQGPNNIRPDGSFLVILTPVDIRPSSAASSVEYMGRLEFIESPKGVGKYWKSNYKPIVPMGLPQNSFTIFHADCGGHNIFPLTLENRFEVAGNPTIA